MTKQHLQAEYAEKARKVTGDLEREADLILARRIKQDILRDEDLISEIRRRVEASRVMVTAYGDTMSSHEYVTITLEYLTDVLREKHKS